MWRANRWTKAALAGLIAFTLAACGGSGSAPESATGGVTMDILADEAPATPAVSAAGVVAQQVVTATVALKITGPDGYSRQHNGSALPMNFTFNPCPVGHYTYEVTAEIGSARFKATGDFDVAKGEMTYVNTVMMQQTNGAPSMNVTAPFIKEVKVTGLNDAGSGGWGEFIHLTAKVEWPDNDLPDMDHFLAVWSSECIGTLTGGHSFFVLPLDIKWYWDLGRKEILMPWADVYTSFKSYCQGEERITLSITNFNSPSCETPGCEITSRVSFTVPYDDQGYEGAVIDFNYAPNALCDSIDNAEPLPGGEVILNALVKDIDSPEAGWTYLWTSDCGGSFADPTALDTTFIAPNENNRECKLTLKVMDGEGGTNYGYVNLKTAPPAFGLPAVPAT